MVNGFSLLLYDEIEVANQEIAALFDGHGQPIDGLLGKIQLARDLCPAFGLDFYMDMFDGPALIQAWKDGLEIIPSL